MRECPFGWMAVEGEAGKEIWSGEYPDEIEVEGSNPRYSAWSGWDPGYYTVGTFVPAFIVSRLIEGDNSKWEVEGYGADGDMGRHRITVSGDDEGPFWDEVESAIDDLIEMGCEDVEDVEKYEPDCEDPEWD